MSTDATSPPLVQNGNADNMDGVPRLEGARRDDSPYSSVTIPIPKVILHSASFMSSLAAVERHHITSVFIVLLVEGCFLKVVGWSYKDVLSAIFFTSLSGHFACLVWASLKRLHCKLDDIFGKIAVLQQAIKSFESNTVVPPPVEYIPVPAKPDIHTFFPRVEPALKPIVHPMVERVDSEPGRLRPVDDDNPPIPYEVSTPDPVENPIVTENHSHIVPPATPQPHHDEDVQVEGSRDNIVEVPAAHLPVVPPVVIKDPPTVPSVQPESHPDEGVKLEGFDDNVAEVPDVRPPAIPPVIKNPPPPPSPSVLPATSSPDLVDGVSVEGWDNIMGGPEVEPEPATHPAVTLNPSVPSAPSGQDRDGDVQLEGMDNIAGVSDTPNASGSSERLTPTNEGDYTRSLPFLREIKQRLEEATKGKIERIPHPDQPSISLSILRWAVRLLMSAASLVPSAFAPHSGYLGPMESTPYYPTGDLSHHRGIAFSTAMDSIDELEAYLPGGDAVRIATKFVALAQALSDLGLHNYALTISGFALDALQRPYTAEPNNARLHVASVLSLRATILCDLKKNDEANDAAERAATLCREHKDSQTAPIPELTYAMLNHAVILNVLDLKDGSAAVADELLGELDESPPESQDVLALCKLCVSTGRIGADDDMATSMADDTINLTRMSMDANSQAVLAGALLAKSKALSSKDQNDAASTVSAEAVTLLRSMSSARPVFSLFLAHALDTHAHHLSRANRKGESYSVRLNAVEHWQTLKNTAGGGVARPLAWSLFELAKFRHKGADRQALREEFRIAEAAVNMFREAEPLDAPGLGDALYLYADRMLELDKNQEAATYAEESVIYFREAVSKDPKYALDLIFSLSLASACLACTEQDDAAFGYAKEAVDVQHGRRGVGDPQYDAHLRKLLMDVVYRATEMDRQDEATPWYQELQSLSWSDGAVARRSGGQGEDDRFRKQTNFWMDATTDETRPNNGPTISSPAASSSTLRVDKGKGKEVAPSPESRSSTPRVDKGKAREVNSSFDSSTAEPNNTRLHVASVLSPWTNILCDLKKNDKANDAAERADTTRSSTALQRSTDNGHSSVIIPVPKKVQRWISTIGKLTPVERQHLVSVVAVVCVETVFLKFMRRDNANILSTIFFTILLGSFAWPVWSNLKRVHCRLDEVFAKIEALQQSIKSLESTTVTRPSIEHVPIPAIPNSPVVSPREDPTPKPNAKPVIKPIDAQFERLVGRPVAADVPHNPPYEITATPKPTKSLDVIENKTPSIIVDPPPIVVAEPLPSMPAPSTLDRGNGIQLEGLDNFCAKPPTLDRGDGIQLEGMDGIFDSGVGKASGSGSSKETPLKSGQGSSRWLPTVRGGKLRIEQSINGRIERLSHLDQSQSIDLSLRRWVMRLLMSAASLSPADFATSVGYLRSPESTPYYPTGDLQCDRSVAFATAMDCLEDLEADAQRNDAQVATKLLELAQALSDLGLSKSALHTSGYASESFDRLYIAEPDKYRLRAASVLSLRANILCDLKRNDEARDAANRAVTLCKEHRESQAGPVPELAYALLTYAVLLCSMGFKDESAAVAYELLCEDDTEPGMTNIFALCKLCISTTRIGIDDHMGMETAEETIELSRTSSDANSQAVLAGALLAKSKMLSSTGQNDAAPTVSAEAVTVLRSMCATRPVFSLFLAHALDTHAHHLSNANRKGESYTTRQDAVEHWQMLKLTAGDAVTRPLAWSLYHLAIFRSTDERRNARREELRLAESAVEMFRHVVPLDASALGSALYHVASRMLELDDNREAATYAEESIQHFREAVALDPKYELNLVHSLSLASSCLACTERAHDAFEYAMQAVELQHERKVKKDEQYNELLRKLLTDVLARAVEADRHVEALPYFQELQALGGLGDAASVLPDLNAIPPGFGSMPIASGSGSNPNVDKGKGREANAVAGSSTLSGRQLADEEIFSPGAAAAQRRLSGLRGTGPPQGNMFGGGPDSNDMLSGLLGAMGGDRGRGGGPSTSPGMGGLGGDDMMSGLLGVMGSGRGRGGGSSTSPGMGGLGGDDMMSGLLGAMGSGRSWGGGPDVGLGMGGLGGDDMMSGLLGAVGGGRGRCGSGAVPGMGGLGGSDLMSGLLGGMGRGRGMSGPGMSSSSGPGTGGRTLGSSGISGMGMGGGGMDDPGLGLGGLGMGGLGGSMRGPGSGGRPGATGRMGGLGGLGGLDDMGGLGGNIDSLISNLGELGPDFFEDGKGEGGSEAKDDKNDHVNADSSAQGGTDSQSSPKPRTGTRSGMGR